MASPSPLHKRKTPTGKLYAIADIHLAFTYNQEAWSALAPHPGDGLILCGDIGETVEHLRQAFSIATRCFDTVWWCPGNHELYTFPTGPTADFRGEHKYQQCVEVARSYDVLTPEDDFVVWEGQGGSSVIAPIFTLYDYSFKPSDVPIDSTLWARDMISQTIPTDEPHLCSLRPKNLQIACADDHIDAVSWAKEQNIEATDEFLLHPDPYSSRPEWCRELVKKFEAKLEAAQAQFPSLPFVIANHWPLRRDLAQLKFIPRFVIWCGTILTEDWHKKFNARAVISGHLHIRRTDWKNGCRFEEVSLGYPRQWKHCAEMGLEINDLLREVLPGPEPPENGEKATQWRRYG